MMAFQSCTHGSVGKSCPVFSFIIFLKRTTSSFKSSVPNSESCFIPFFSFSSSIISSKTSSSSFSTGFKPITTSPYICMKRRYESQAKRGVCVLRAMASTAFSFNPRFKIVSIIPGMEALAPERTETRRGFSSSPNLGPPTTRSI